MNWGGEDTLEKQDDVGIELIVEGGDEFKH